MSNSITGTVDTECLTVAAMNRCYCRQINWQLLAEQQSEYQNASGSVVDVQNRIYTALELTPKNTNSAAIFIRISKDCFASDQCSKSQILW